MRSSRTSRSVKSRHAPSLKMLQFCRTSTNALPLWRPARSSVCLQVLGVGVDGAGDERRLRGEGERQRLDRGVDGAGRGRLRALAELRRRRGLALGQPVDPVVEHDQLEVDVATHRVDHVVAADRQRVAVAGDDPDHEVGAGRLEARRERRRTAVDRVEPEGVHVVRQPTRAADARDEDDVLLLVAEVGHHLLGLGKDRIVPAAGAPADLLVGHEVLAGQRDDLRVLGAQRGLCAVARRRSCRRRSCRRRSCPWSPRSCRQSHDPLRLLHDLGDPEGLATHAVVADRRR